MLTFAEKDPNRLADLVTVRTVLLDNLWKRRKISSYVVTLAPPA